MGNPRRPRNRVPEFASRPARPRAVEQAAPAAPSEASPAPSEDSHGSHDASDGRRVRFYSWIALLAAGLGLPVLRAVGVIGWNWALVLAPFTLFGVVMAGALLVFVFPERFERIRALFSGRDSSATATPPPEQLERPANAEGGERILAQHPELLAALCHGFRMKRLTATVLNRAVTDPWGVYSAALAASAGELEELHVVARLHAERMAQMGKKARQGRRPSDADVMKHAVDAFWKCAQKTIAGRGHPDCSFEHVTAIYGTHSPNRDANLKAVAPKVRALLERQYPQLKTARLEDGSQVKFEEWQRKAAQDHAEIARLRKEGERQRQTIEGNEAQMRELREKLEALHASNAAYRAEVREAARGEQEQALDDMRAAIDRASLENARSAQRASVEAERLAASIAELTAERDALERALFEGEHDDLGGAARDLTGVRVLLVGGDDRQIRPLREALEARGAQLMHEDSVRASEHVPNAHLVVFWIRYLSHPTYFGVRQKVRALNAAHCYWMKTSPDSLVGLVERSLCR